MKTISLKLEDDLADSLVCRAKKMGASKSNIVREALREYTKIKQGVATGSCLDLYGKLFGCVEGPRDLSFNKEHLKEFGG